MSIKYQILLLLFWFLRMGTPMDQDAEFYPKKLQTLHDCETFMMQDRYKIAVCDAYYNMNSAETGFFLDSNFKSALKSCLDYAKTVIKKDNLLKRTVIYNIKNVKDYRSGMVSDDMVSLESSTESFIIVMPQIKWLIGPNSNPAEVSEGIGKLHVSWLVISPSETERLNSYYNQEFFDKLGDIDDLSAVTSKYVRLNGWHTKNMPFTPKLENNMFKTMTGLILWVEKANAHKIGQNEAKMFLNGSTQISVWYDMPGSPKVAGALMATPCIGTMGALLVVITLFRDVL